VSGAVIDSVLIYDSMYVALQGLGWGGRRH
jgi:hypothetical protein